MALEEIVRQLVQGAKSGTLKSESGLQPLTITSDRHSEAAPEIVRELHLVDKLLRQVLGDCCEAKRAWPLLLHGTAGVGKTCAALALSDYIVGRCFYRTSTVLAQEYLKAIRGDLTTVGLNGCEYPVSQDWIWQQVRNRSLVILDELGQSKESNKTEYDSVKQLLDHRGHRPAIYLSNLAPGDLVQVYDDRVVSRLCAGTVFEIAGKDRRLAL